MYRCQVCGKQSLPGSKCFVIIAKTAEYEHSYRPKSIPIRIEKHNEYADDMGGRGTQIVKELRACQDCRHFSAELVDEPDSWRRNYKERNSDEERDSGVLEFGD